VTAAHRCRNFDRGVREPKIAAGHGRRGARQILRKFQCIICSIDGDKGRSGLVQRMMDREWEVTMREKGLVIAFCALCAATGATVLTAASARAIPMVGYSVHSAAIHKATTIQKVRYTCRRHRCYYVSRPERAIRYNRYYRNGMYPGEAQYNYHYWGSPLNDP
jgi:hypothetical protein